MRRAAKIDRNQPEIVDALRAIGCSVQSLAAVGHGCPDLLVGYRGWTWLLEVKDGGKVPSARRRTADQELWHRDWFGDRVRVVTSVEEAIAAVRLPDEHKTTGGELMRAKGYTPRKRGMSAGELMPEERAPLDEACVHGKQE